MKKKYMISFFLIFALITSTITVLAAPPDDTGPFADNVEEYNQGLRNNGTPVPADRSIPEEALGVTDLSLSPPSFFSLGFGGDITVSFDNYICSDEGADITVYEVTSGNYPEEAAEVMVSQDNITWFSVGDVNNKGTSSVDVPDALDWVKYVKIIDKTDPAIHPSDSDGYDLDAVEALNSSPDIAGCLPPNLPPVVNPGGPYYDFEGSPVTFDGSGTTDPEGDALTYEWSFGDGVTGVGVSPIHIYADNADFTVCLTATDTADNAVTACTVAYIANVPPAVGPITVDQMIVPIGTAINATSPFTDPGTDDTHTAIWAWGDGASSPGAVSEISGSGTVDGSHTYNDAGEYEIKLTVTDDDGGVGTATTQVLVYDPRDFVTGGGWFWLPDGSCASCGGDNIKVTFGLVAKYHKNLDSPTGSTEVQFQGADINFHARDYEWLVITGPKAIYEGIGTINGSGRYGFILSVIDGKLNNANGNKDLFRIKIWDDTTGDLIVDTQMGDPDLADPTTAVQGSIVIHDR